MICRSSTTGMSEHPDVTAVAQDALGSTNRAEQAVRCLQGADRRGWSGQEFAEVGRCQFGAFFGQEVPASGHELDPHARRV
jgi:hypothetical protein